MKVLKKIGVLTLVGVMTIGLFGCSAVPGTSKSSVAVNVSDLSAEEIAAVEGTYVGENGSGLTFFANGTSSYYYKTYSDVEAGNLWQYKDGILTWNSKELGCDIYAEVKDGDTTQLRFKSDSVLWDDENYIKVDDDAEVLTKEQYLELIDKTNGNTDIDTKYEESTDLGKETSDAGREDLSENAVTVKVTDKQNIEADIYNGIYSNRVNLVIEVTNNTEKDIQGVQGILIIDDLFGKNIKKSRCNFTGKIIAPGQTVSFEDLGLDINEYIDSDKKLYNEKYEDLQFTYQVDSIVYAEEADAAEKNITSGSDKVTITCVEKKNIEEDIYNGRYSPYVQFIFEVENHSDKDIKGIQGTVTVSDLFGNKIIKSNCDFTGTTIKAGETATITDRYLEINKFLDEDVKLYNEDYEDLQFQYEVTDIVYSE